MHAKHFIAWVGALAVLPLLLAWTPPAYQQPPARMVPPSAVPGKDPNSAMRQLQTTLADLKHEVKNHETEIRTFEERLQTQESAMEALRQQMEENLESQKDYARANHINTEGRIDALDQTIYTVIADLKQMKSQANDSVNVLGQYKQKLSELEKIIDAQNQHMKSLELALNSMIELMQAKEAADKIAQNKSTEKAKTYTVQAGDTLDKIARKLGVSIQSLKERNNLSQDRIRVGQILQIP